jgi:hypothetical protein
VTSWINLTALWQIVVVGLLAGAGLPAVFAIGLRALAIGNPVLQTTGTGSEASADSDHVSGGNPLGIAVAGLCFALVLAAIGYGIYLIVSAS